MTKNTIKILAIVGVLSLAVVAMGAVIQGTDSTGKPRDVKVNTSGQPIVSHAPLRLVGNAKSYCVGITDTDTDFTLSTTTDYFRICAAGNTAYLTFKDTAPAVTTVVGGYDLWVQSGQCKYQQITELLVAVKGLATAGTVCFEPLL